MWIFSFLIFYEKRINVFLIFEFLCIFLVFGWVIIEQVIWY